MTVGIDGPRGDHTTAECGDVSEVDAMFGVQHTRFLNSPSPAKHSVVVFFFKQSRYRQSEWRHGSRIFFFFPFSHIHYGRIIDAISPRRRDVSCPYLIDFGAEIQMKLRWNCSRHRRFSTATLFGAVICSFRCWRGGEGRRGTQTDTRRRHHGQ